MTSQSNNKGPKKKWQFWIDCGGTFTDIIAIPPDGRLLSNKLLSDNPGVYADAALHGIREFMGLQAKQNIPVDQIEIIKMGTTIATNALLERKGERTLLAITAGLEDLIEIGHQARPDTFALNIRKAALLYDDVIAVRERVYADGRIHLPLDIPRTQLLLQEKYDNGFRSIAIVLMHAYMYSSHEHEVAKLAAQIGYQQISTSHTVSPLIKIVPRGETTIVDAYLTPVLRRHVDQISRAMGENSSGKLLFMQSSGGLTDANTFQGKNAILSGPAGGVIGAVYAAGIAGFEKIIGFDMGGTSTDVSHYAGEFEKTYEAELAGVKMRVPMLHIHTVAAGGGSVLAYDGNRFRVGPDSVGANPGPVSYGFGGSLAVTDINVCLGKIQPEYFPKIFGPNRNKMLDRRSAVEAFSEIAKQLGDGRTPEEIAEGFLQIAIEHMAQAIKKISVARGYNVRTYILNCFGGAAGQHACLVAERLGMQRIFIHPLAGVLSAYGMGLADIHTESQLMFERALDESVVAALEQDISDLIAKNCLSLEHQGLAENDISHSAWALLRYQGTDTTIQIPINDIETMRGGFEESHQRQYGFLSIDKTIIIETLGATSAGGGHQRAEPTIAEPVIGDAKPVTVTNIYSSRQWHKAPVYQLDQLTYGHTIDGPAIIVAATGTIVIEPNWRAEVNQYQHIILHCVSLQLHLEPTSTEFDPVKLEIFNSLFMSIAEQMGIVLRNTSRSVNIKERLDFSCAIFDQQGNLVANAPHVPVHLGSMDTSVKVVINSQQIINPGDVFVQNNPYNGGSHLPDITVITPVFSDNNDTIIFYLASRAHHEDIGGIAPGSMSPLATTIQQEGIIIDCLKLVDQGEFLHQTIHRALSSGDYPARNIDQNIADLIAQIAANNTGVNELKNMVANYDLATVHAYMSYIQESGELAVRKVLGNLSDGSFCYQLDSGAKIKVAIRIDHANNSAVIDFSGTSPQQPSNFNAPRAICNAAVLYVFRCLIDDDIPLNAGCMRPLTIVIPEGSMLSPTYPAAVVAGNVETSQAITNALFAALGVLGSSQGTMNNLTFGDQARQYYETLCSGSPAGLGFNGTAAVHTHMTNTRLTDPEVLEQRHPVVLEEFSIRRGSGGQGQWCAGDGVYRRIRFLEEMELSILSDHRRIAPFGLQGGLPGQVGKNWLVRADSSIEKLPGCTQTQVKSNDTINIQTPTGGGFGKKP